MSDEEEDFDGSGSSEGGDFSDYSEDDWKPDGESEEESEGGTQESPSSSSPDKQTRPAAKKTAPPANRRPAQKKPTTTSGKVMAGSILELLEAAKSKKREKLHLSAAEAGPSKVADDSPMPERRKRADESEESSSSGDENLVSPSKIDLRSSFFQSVSSKEQDHRVPTPNFDCNIGVGTLSDSEEVEEDEEEDGENKEAAQNVMENLRNFAQTLDDAKENLRKYKDASQPAADSATDVSQLLALGETSKADAVAVSPVAKKRANNRKRAHTREEESGESDWEEVADVKVAEQQRAPENVDVLLDVPDRRLAKMQNDLEVALKRQLNKEKRDQQVALHQAGLREWLEQGNYINGILNDTALFASSLKLLPSAQAYPKDKADLKYFEQITKWYAGTMKLSPTAEIYPSLLDDLHMRESLRKQIEAKEAKSKRDFVLIFIILLRAIGIQCRMVVNLVVPPIRPPQSELCRITTKPKAEASLEKSKRKPPQPSGSAKKKRKTTKKEEEGSSDEDVDYDEIAEKLSKSKQQQKKKTPSKENESDKKSNSRERSTHRKDHEASTSQSSTFRSKNKSSASSSLSKSSRPADSPIARPRTRSRTPAIVIPQVDGLHDDPPFSPIGKRTRSRSNTPVNPPPPPTLVKRVLVSKHAVDSPIKTKRSTNTLQVPNTQLFAVDPTEKKTVTRARKSPARTKTVKVEKVHKDIVQKDVQPVKKTPRLSVADPIDRRVLSTDDDEEQKDSLKKPTGTRIDFWAEAWSEKEEKWMAVDLFKKKVDAPETLIRSASVPIAYVLAWNNNSAVKDVSLRYCPQWHSVNKKMRTEQGFIDQALKPFLGTESSRDTKENEELQRLVLDRPMPTSISDFKNHPVYALERHLLKFEAIYPPNPLTLGFVRGEAVYARECVHTLHSRELWVKQARVVKPAETPYKVVTARPKWERATNTVIKDLPLELFGLWQTSPYEPPVAENGVVPKNAYGNVELFKECMLPINTVHLPYPGLNKVCKRLKVDYAPAVVGFDFHSGYSHPVYEGFVVCKEFAELVTDAWIRDTEEAAKKEAEKAKGRVFGNWKRLIKGLLIKRRLQLRYNFKEEDDQEEGMEGVK